MPMDAADSEPRGAFDPRNITYPVSFELRLIYAKDHAASLAAAVPAALDGTGTAHGPFAAAESGAAYGKARVSVTFMDRESMRAAYAALAALPGVKAVI